MKINLDEINEAAKEAALSASIKTAEERARAVGSSFFSDIIENLKAGGVDEEQVASLERELERSTDRNETILRVIRKGGDIAERIRSFLNP